MCLQMSFIVVCGDSSDSSEGAKEYCVSCFLAEILNWNHSCTGRVQQNPGPELSSDRCCIKTALELLATA